MIFASIFCLVSIIDISRDIRTVKLRLGYKRTVFRYMAVAGLVLGLWGISALSVTDSLVLFTLSAVLTVGMIVYLHSERRSHMERKSKAQESATAIATMAKFIADTLTLNYPPETLKALLNVPVKQLEDELKTLTAYVNALK